MLCLRPLTPDEHKTITRWRHSRTEGGEVIATALTNPQHRDVPFASWTLDRLEAYLNAEKGFPIKRSRIDALLIEQGVR